MSPIGTTRTARIAGRVSGLSAARSDSGGRCRRGTRAMMPTSAAVPTPTTRNSGIRQSVCPITSPTGTPSAVAKRKPPMTSERALPR